LSGHVTGKGEIRNTQIILVGKLLAKRPLVRQRSRWKDSGREILGRWAVSEEADGNSSGSCPKTGSFYHCVNIVNVCALYKVTL